MKKQNRRKKAAVLAISYLSAAAVAFGILAGSCYERAKRAEQLLQAGYQRAFTELVTAVSEMDTALQKSVYATSPGMISAVCTQVFGKAMTAQQALGVLPFSTQELEQTAGFISRVGDYAYVLSRSAAAESGYSAEELENLRALSDTASLLALNMRSLQTELMDGVLTMDEQLSSQRRLDELERSMPATLEGSMRLIEQEFPETPSLVYDGPFSEHITMAQPLALEGLDEVSEDEARAAAAYFTGVSKSKLHLAADCEGDLPCYGFSAELRDGTLSVAVTKQGGKVLSLLSSRQAEEAERSDEEIGEIARRFLAERGFSGMAETYRIRQGGVVTINYAWRQGEVLCYSDLVKVSVAEDTGAVCGFEAKGYWMTHRERELPAAAVSAEEARTRVPEGLTILAEQLALVPSDGKVERLCHEFKCADGEERHCLIYVSAETGEQEKILLLIEDETGALTI